MHQARMKYGDQRTLDRNGMLIDSYPDYRPSEVSHVKNMGN